MIPAMIALVKLSHNALTKMLLFILILLDDTTPLRWIAALALRHTQQGAAAHNQSITLLTQMNRKSPHFHTAYEQCDSAPVATSIGNLLRVRCAVYFLL